MSEGVAPPRIYLASWAARGGRRVGGRLVDSVPALAFTIAVMFIGPGGRPVAQCLVILAGVTAWETTWVTRQGATPGMQAVGLRVVAFDHPQPGVPWLLALRRTVPVACCYLLPFPGTLVMCTMPVVLLLSMGTSPFRRGFHDRASDTVVVSAAMTFTLTREILDSWYEPASLAVMTPWGRAPDLHERRRARAHRLDGLHWLAALSVGGALVMTLLSGVVWPLLWLALIWMVVISVDEARRISTDGTTPGHAYAGFKVVDVATGSPPSRGRALARSFVLAPLLYVPPFQLVLGLWVRASAYHRGPHDLVGRTVVVEPDFVPPRFAAPVPPVDPVSHMPVPSPVVSPHLPPRATPHPSRIGPF